MEANTLEEIISNGALIPPIDPVAQAEMLKTLIYDMDKRGVLGLNARSRAAMFDMDRLAIEVSSAIERPIGDH